VNVRQGPGERLGHLLRADRVSKAANVSQAAPCPCSNNPDYIGLLTLSASHTSVPAQDFLRLRCASCADAEHAGTPIAVPVDRKNGIPPDVSTIMYF
jgi:hypothetical protein